MNHSTKPRKTACLTQVALASLSFLTIAYSDSSMAEKKLPKPAKVSETVVDSVVASVNGKPLTFLEVSARMRGKRALELRQAPSDPEFRQLLDTVILEQIIQDEAQNRKIDVSQDEIERFISEVANRNGLSKEGFIKALQDEGNNLEDYKKQVRLEILKSKLGAAVLQGGVAVSANEVQEYLKQNPVVQNSGIKIRLRQIFTAKLDGNSEEAKKKIEQAQAKLSAGDKFSDVAREYSESSEASDGGLLGEVTENELSPTIFQAVSTLSEDHYSSIVESESGFHLFYVEKRIQNEHDQGQNSERELEARRMLENQKLQEKMSNYFSVEILKNHSVDKKI